MAIDIHAPTFNSYILSLQTTTYSGNLKIPKDQVVPLSDTFSSSGVCCSKADLVNPGLVETFTQVTNQQEHLYLEEICFNATYLR